MNIALDINDNGDVEEQCDMAGCMKLMMKIKTKVDHKTLTHCQITRIILVPSVM